MKKEILIAYFVLLCFVAFCEDNAYGVLDKTPFSIKVEHRLNPWMLFLFTVHHDNVLVINDEPFGYDYKEVSREAIAYSDYVRVTYIPYLYPLWKRYEYTDFQKTEFAKKVFFRERELVQKMKPEPVWPTLMLNFVFGGGGVAFATTGFCLLNENPDDSGLFFAIGGGCLGVVVLINLIDLLLNAGSYEAMQRMAEKYDGKPIAE